MAPMSRTKGRMEVNTYIVKIIIYLSFPFAPRDHITAWFVARCQTCVSENIQRKLRRKLLKVSGSRSRKYQRKISVDFIGISASSEGK